MVAEHAPGCVCPGKPYVNGCVCVCARIISRQRGRGSLGG